MDLKSEIQKNLDDTLLKYGILSFHIRRIKTDEVEGQGVEINNDEYAVFTINSNDCLLYGDGKPKIVRRHITINYYYDYDRHDNRYTEVTHRIEDIKRAFLKDIHFKLKNGGTDLPDMDSPYRGKVIEFVYTGVADNE